MDKLNLLNTDTKVAELTVLIIERAILGERADKTS